MLNSLNGKVFKSYEDNKRVGIGYRTVKPWKATRDVTYFYDNLKITLKPEFTAFQRRL